MKMYEKGLDQEKILQRLDQIDSPDNAQGEYNIDTDTIALISDYIVQSEDQIKAQKQLIARYKSHRKIVDTLIMMYPDQTPSIEDVMAEALEK